MKENSYNQALSKRDLFYILFKHKITILILSLSIILTVIAGVYILPEKYESRATILIKLGRENVISPTLASPSQQQVITMGLRKEDINSEIKILYNRFIVEKVVEKLGTDFLFPKGEKPKSFFKRINFELKRAIKIIWDIINEIFYRLNLKKRLSPYENAVEGVHKNITAEQVRDSDVIEVKFKWHHPDIAKEVVNTLIDFYLVHHLEAHKTSGAHDFLQRQVEIIDKRLRDSENRLKLLKERQEITSYENQSKLLLEDVNNAKASLKKTQNDLAETNKIIDEIKIQMSSLMRAITPGFNTTYKEAEKELLLHEVRLKALNAKKEMEEQHIRSYQKELERLNLYEIELKQLSRQIQIDEENYFLYRKKLEEARISDVLDTARIVNVKVIEPATASFIPVRPKKLLIISLGVVLSLISGIGIAFLSEYLDHSIQTEEDIKRYLDLPLLASIQERKR